MRDAGWIFAVIVCIFLFAGDPDLHDLLMRNLAGACKP